MKDDHFATIVIAALMLVIVLGVTVARLSSSDTEARAALLDSGYTDITMTGHEWGCHRDDWSCSGFHATGPTGRPVKGVVGCGSVGCANTCTVRIGR